jgi:hypothetical protein
MNISNWEVATRNIDIGWEHGAFATEFKGFPKKFT